jgi:hypothetical protein
MVKIIILSGLVMLLFAGRLSSQTYNQIYCDYHKNDSLKANSLYFDVESSGFFKNNEYFGNLIKGYTLTGYNFIPRLKYIIGDRSSISGGLYLQAYSGRNGRHKILPLFRLQTSLSPNIELVMGEIYGSLNHNLISPLYHFDNYFFDRIEQGFQFLINYERLRSDIWINWEEFILWEDPFQERFTFGTSSDIKVVKSGIFAGDIHFQSLISHRGGQINNVDTTIQNLVNINPGISFNFNINKKSLVALYAFIPVSADLSPEPESKYLSGIGYLPGLKFENQSFYIAAEYWRSYRFIGHKGNPLFSAVSDNGLFYSDYGELVDLKFRYSKKYENGMVLAAGAEAYYNLINSNIEYNYSLYLIFKEKFFLK